MVVQRVVMTGPRDVRMVSDDLSDDPPLPYEVVMQTHYSLISPGTELAHYTGTSDLNHIGPSPYPWYPGYAAVGEVVAAGAETGLHSGMLILAHTSHQSAVRFDLRQRVCVRVPSGVAPQLATMARLAQVSAVGLRTSQGRAGEGAAVIGLGLVGNCAAQLARAAGMQVLGVDTLESRRTLAAQCGIGLVADPRDTEALARAAAQLEGGCRLVVECSGQPRGVETALSLVARYGEVVLVGAAWQRQTEVLATDIVRPIFDKFVTLRSGWEWQLPLYGTQPPGSIASCTGWALACMQSGSLVVPPLISDVIAPEAAGAAYHHLLEEPAAHLGIVIDWTGTTY